MNGTRSAAPAAKANAVGDERAKGAVRRVLEVSAPLPRTDFAAIFPVNVRPARG